MQLHETHAIVYRCLEHVLFEEAGGADEQRFLMVRVIAELLGAHVDQVVNIERLTIYVGRPEEVLLLVLVADHHLRLGLRQVRQVALNVCTRRVLQEAQVLGVTRWVPLVSALCRHLAIKRRRKLGHVHFSAIQRCLRGSSERRRTLSRLSVLHASVASWSRIRQE